MPEEPESDVPVEAATPTSVDEPYRVLEVAPRTPTIVELWLRPLADPLRYRPGEYVLLEDAEHEVAPRSYSVANAPRADGLISLLVTRVRGGQASTWVHERLRTGQTVAITGPYGTFVDDPARTAPAVYLAGGSGLAPIRALAEAALSGARRSLTLIFSARTEADVLDRERFAAWEARSARFRYVRTLTREHGEPPRGRIPILLASLVGTLADHDVFVAGAPGFVRACAAAAEACGAPRERVRTEVFFGEPEPWTDTFPQVRGKT
jgi:CDP-4-dehydro-6-deoxyglucose reductase